MPTPVNIAPAQGKLGVLLVGLGAVSTTTIAGVLAIRKGLSQPIGSLTQMGTIRLGKRTEGRSPRINEVVPLSGLDDLVFGGWDRPLRIARTPAIVVVLTAPRPTSRTPSLPCAGAMFTGVGTRGNYISHQSLVTSHQPDGHQASVNGQQSTVIGHPTRELRCLSAVD